MIGEIAICIKALDTAFNLVHRGIEKKKEVDQMSAEIRGFFKSKEVVEKKIIEAKKNDNDDLFLGSAIEEAISVSQQEERIEKMMARIGAHYSDQGKSHKWADIKLDAKKIQRKRDLKAAAQEQKLKAKKLAASKKTAKQKKIQDYLIAFSVLGGLLIILFLMIIFILRI